MKVIYQFNGEDIGVPEEVAKAINDLDLRESSQQKAKSSIVHYIKWVNDTNRDFPIENDMKSHVRLIDSYMGWLKKNEYARNTISGRWLWVSRLYKELSMDLLNEYAFLEENPIDMLEDHDKTRKDYLPAQSEQSQEKAKYYVDKEDLDLILDNLPSPVFRSEVLIKLAWTTGLRSSEIANLKSENVNLEDNLLEGFWVPKTLESRDIWIPDTTVWYLDQWLNGGYRDSYSYAGESDYLFPANKCERIHPSRLTKIIDKAAQNAGIQQALGEDKAGNTRWKVTAHAFRRGHGMYLLQKGKSLPEIQARLGHNSPDQTSDYLPIDTAETRKSLGSIRF